MDVNKRPDKPKDNISIKISAGSSKREVKEEVKVRNTEKHVGNCKDVVLNGKGVQKIEPEQKKNEPADNSKFPVDESSESEDDVKAKESDSDIEVAVIEDDIDLEDLMRQKVRNVRDTIIWCLYCEWSCILITCLPSMVLKQSMLYQLNFCDFEHK